MKNRNYEIFLDEIINDGGAIHHIQLVNKYPKKNQYIKGIYYFEIDEETFIKNQKKGLYNRSNVINRIYEK